MNYVNEQNMQEILDGIARKIGQGGGSGAGLEDWQASHEYAEKDICVYNGQIYKAIVGFESDTTFSTIQILEEYELQSGDTPIVYTQGTDISIDDIVSYDGNYYKALYDFTCGDTFGLYALEEYVPKELTEVQEAEIINHFMPNIYSGGNMSIEDSTPIGTIISFMGTTAPENYLVCDGDTYNIVDYIELADFIKEQFGSYDYFGGDGITTFAVPDLQGEFLRMTGTNSHENQGSGANVGVHQDGTTFGNTAEIVSGSSTTLRVTTPSRTQELENFDSHVEYSPTGGTFNTFTPSSTASYGGEIASIVTSRPTNTSVLYCIKYKMSITNAEEIKDLTTADIQQIINAYNPVFDSDGGGTTGAGLEDWKANNDYKENDIFVNQGQIYKAIVDFTSGSTFSIIQILDEYELQTGDVPIAYNKDTSIHIDDIVSYDSNYYIALQNFVCGEEFGLYAFEQYTPKELTTAQEQQIVQHWQEYLGTGSGSSESSPTHYSTTEKMVGTWIDGKPIYQITNEVSFSNKAVGSYDWIRLVNRTDIDLDRLIFSYAKIIFDGHSNDEYIAPYYAIGAFSGVDNSHPAAAALATSNGGISLQLQQYFYNATLSGKIVFTIQYTKTTD